MQSKNACDEQCRIYNFFNSVEYSQLAWLLNTSLFKHYPFTANVVELFLSPVLNMSPFLRAVLPHLSDAPDQGRATPHSKSTLVNKRNK